MKTLLVVDDVPANLSVLIDAASAAGYRVLLAESGERALKLAAKTRPDLVLLDVMMPGLDGYATCRRLKADPALRDVPVIFLSALDDATDKIAGLEAGGLDYVAKPLDPAEVLARVQVHLELRRLRTELQEEVHRRQEAERSLRQSLDRAVLVATLDGQILFATQRASRLLETHFGHGQVDSLPDGLLTATGTQEVTTATGRLRVRRFAEVGQAECATLLLEEIGVSAAGRLEKLGLTPREAEVLFWIAEGKSNPEIALILANTAGTVKKQVQSILDKLGLENRMIAARRAREILDAP
jgi:DNA-binding response OmpR family regulator/DNA-binding CsgD family transcriptional regulator